MKSRAFSSRFKVLITRRILPEAGRVLEAAGIRVAQGGAAPMDRGTLRRRAAGADALLSMLSDPIDAAFLDACPALRIVANHAVGFDNIDLKAAASRGVMVTHTPYVLTRATAELTWALILACARRLPEGDRLTRSGGFRGWDPLLLLGQELGGKTLGILGAGRIGRTVARIGFGFGMRVRYATRATRPAAFGRFLAEADVVSVHVPLTPATRHLIARDALARMKPTAILVNTSRGPVVDEDALVEALRRHQIASAGLDVYEREPRLARGLSRLPNAVLLPHLGSATREARRAMALRAARNIIQGLTGQRPGDLLTPWPLTPRCSMLE
jgi:glyoxylate reductase